MLRRRKPVVLTVASDRQQPLVTFQPTLRAWRARYLAQREALAGTSGKATEQATTAQPQRTAAF